MSIVGDIVKMELWLSKHDPPRRNTAPGHHQWLDQMQPDEDARAEEIEMASAQEQADNRKPPWGRRL